jgi:hypothetical protein
MRTPIELAACAIGLRQIVAKIPNQNGHNRIAGAFSNLRDGWQRSPPIASNLLMSAPFSMKLAAGRGKS